MVYDSVAGLEEKRNANKVAKENTVFASSDVRTQCDDNVDSNLMLKNNINGLCNDFEKMYQASTFLDMQVFKVFENLHICYFLFVSSLKKHMNRKY